MDLANTEHGSRSQSIVRPARSSSNADPPPPGIVTWMPLALSMPDVGSVARASCSYSHDYSGRASLPRRAPLFIVLPGQSLASYILHLHLPSPPSVAHLPLATCSLLLAPCSPAHLLTFSPSLLHTQYTQLYLDAPPSLFPEACSCPSQVCSQQHLQAQFLLRFSVKGTGP
ncbi:uncharacterized protein K444DRAFT_439008 [Hyaloscypha bicolor E]|uniref:Uncharacterized protein n=1 Tax=Hyaloscypha bicolor E TaxID=1095630 RepID=A0A2J6T588_9HELO|nr:uncharacterized protein K444DRAFT_439008 [Hyaloscypha bicolor E]PMD58186.1 hypothetical protein K444DRAFT_439008 [Hyaloscypha bicolor E]